MTAPSPTHTPTHTLFNLLYAVASLLGVGVSSERETSEHVRYLLAVLVPIYLINIMIMIIISGIIIIYIIPVHKVKNHYA